MNFKQVPIVYIKPDPNQPRKFFDETAMLELTNSVIEKEVIQPIIVRGVEPNYMLVCGERRLRAATAVMEMFPIRNTIPAVIRQMDDDEALELQIIENLQRKDVHPMEEAVAFESMLQHGLDAKQIAGKMGKSDFFIRQRVKLCALIDDWQKAFFANRVSITEVLKIVSFDKASQQALYEMNENRTDEIKFSNWDISKYSGRLTDGLFDLADGSLNKLMGPCINCKWNSATALLFENAGSTASCGNKGCFTIKCNNAFERKIEESLQDPAMIFLTEDYRVQKNTLTARIEKAGYAVYGHESYDKQNTNDKPDYEDFKSDWLDDNDDDVSGCEEAFQKELQEWQDDQADFEKGVASGKFKKAFVIEGREKGKFVFIKLNNKKSAAASSSKGNQAATSQNDIKEEIERLTAKEKRSKELDQEKIWENIRRHYKPDITAGMYKHDLNRVENEAAALAIFEKISSDHRTPFCKLFNIKDWLKPDFSTTTDEQLRQMIRFFFLDALPAFAMSVTSYKHAVCMKIADDYFPSVLFETVSDQDKIANKRISRVNEKIAALKKQLKDLQPKKEKTAAGKKNALAKGIAQLLEKDSPVEEPGAGKTITKGEAIDQISARYPDVPKQTIGELLDETTPAKDSTIKKAVKKLLSKTEQ